MLLLLWLSSLTLVSSCSFNASDVVLERRLVHLDLKGAPPKISYFVSFFPFIARLGATGILLEYEDMFPYHGPLKRLSRRNAYTKTEVQALLALARRHRLEIIPLIQTFGHMEFVLKHRQFASLSEIPSESYTICPSDNGTQFLIEAMVNQILELHPDARWLHIGCDEVFQLGKCNRCQDQMKKLGIDRKRLFLNHVSTVATYVRAAYPSVQVIIWDDILQSIEDKDILKSGIPTQVIPMVWKYHRNVWNDLPRLLWEKYVRLFPKLWIASAFKGATGQNQQLTNLRHHLENHCSWNEVVREFGNRTEFLGITITGWQRYNHLSHLCELLPSGLPSLTLDLLYLGRDESVGSVDDLLNRTSSVLRCKKRLDLDRWEDCDCDFPGSDVWKAVLQHDLFERHSRYRMGTNELLERGHGVRDFVNRSFGMIYSDDTVTEWLETYMDPLIDRINYDVRRNSNVIQKVHMG